MVGRESGMAPPVGYAGGRWNGGGLHSLAHRHFEETVFSAERNNENFLKLGK